MDTAAIKIHWRKIVGRHFVGRHWNKDNIMAGVGLPG
jgi:hypothetical protein